MEDKAERLKIPEGMKDTGKTRSSESTKYSTYEFTETEAVGKEPAWVFSGFSGIDHCYWLCIFIEMVTMRTLEIIPFVGLPCPTSICYLLFHLLFILSC